MIVEFEFYFSNAQKWFFNVTWRFSLLHCKISIVFLVLIQGVPSENLYNFPSNYKTRIIRRHASSSVTFWSENPIHQKLSTEVLPSAASVLLHNHSRCYGKELQEMKKEIEYFVKQ